MGSIRLRLLVSLLAVLCVVLGWVSWSAYAIARYSLELRQKGVREMLQARYESAEQRVREQFDEKLLRDAHTLAGLARFQWRWPRLRLFSLGALTAILNQGAYASIPLHLGAEAHMPLAFRVQWMLAPEVELPEELLPGDESEWYFQFALINGDVLQTSPNLVEPWRLPSQVRDNLRLLEAYFDTVEGSGQEPLRRVTVRVPASRWRLFWRERWSSERAGLVNPPRGRPGQVPPRGERPADGAKPPRPLGTPATPPSPPPFVDQAAPQLLVSVARSLAPLQAEMEQLAQQRDQHLQQGEEESRAALRAFGWILLLTNLGTFVVAGLVGWLVLRRQMKPLEAIAEAVSRVSEKSFALPIQDDKVPAELVPVVEKLRQTLGSLQQAFEREKRAVADISHDLRTPITALLTTLEVALRRPRSPEEYRQILQNCQHLAEQLRHLAERVLALARLDAGVDQIRKEWFSLPALVEDCLRTVEPLAQPREVQLHSQVDVNFCYTDAAKLRDILLNLLDNAVYYNHAGGSVWVRATQENGQVCLEVSDTGVGMTPEVQARIFQRFYRADPSREPANGRAGLGLAIVHGYVTMLGGAIEVESQPGHGSTFRVKLPQPAPCPTEAFAAS
ncbi:MAG: HAMP domain-containing sensor histidine kinase [Gemmatales bacterium]|nr:HAMP domain-containing histidine kinase [Gemmatales bacterium]MDW8174072.1 HAMP domain-containing sensor histidine kinase [Gemmatales bacterium]